MRAFAINWYPQDYEPAKDLSLEVLPSMTLELVVEGLEQPTEIRFPKAHSNKMVVLQKEGKAVVFTEDEKGIFGPPEPFFSLDVTSRSEQGLLGLAFHPDYMNNGTFYIHATPKKGSTRGQISEWTFDPSADNWSATFRRSIIEVEQPYGNHNGGQLQFGDDGCLYIGMGDGGWREDPHEHGQNRKSLLGAMLRIRVSPEFTEPYQVPDDNPYVGNKDFLPEIWAYGLRNPWRFMMVGNEAIIADVGQDKFEEISIATAGANLGWNILEAEHCFNSEQCDPSGTVLPIWSYPREDGISITGGYIIKDGSNLDGWYIFGDFRTGKVWGFPYQANLKTRVQPKELISTGLLIVTFGIRSSGELYVADFGKGTIHQLSPI